MSLENVLDQTIHNNYILYVDRQTIGTDKLDVRVYNTILRLQTLRHILNRFIAVFIIKPEQYSYTAY